MCTFENGHLNEACVMCGHANIVHAEAEPLPAPLHVHTPLPEKHHHSLPLNPLSVQLNIDPNGDADNIINKLFLAYQPPTLPLNMPSIPSPMSM
jgi:hypothetical protein